MSLYDFLFGQVAFLFYLFRAGRENGIRADSEAACPVVSVGHYQGCRGAVPLQEHRG